MLRRAFALTAVAGLFAAVTGAASAQVTFGGASGALSASATFSTDGTGDLFLTLTNTSTGNTSYVPSQGLTAVFFNVTGNPTLVPVSATLPSGSNIANPGDCNSSPNLCNAQPTDVSTEWTYKKNIGAIGSVVPASNDGISSSGFSVFGPNDAFDTASTPLDTPVPDGLNFAIVGSDYTDGSGNGGMQVPLIRDATTFELSGLGSLTNADLVNDISNVTFAYGTTPDASITDGSVVICTPGVDCPHSEVPEPTDISILAVGLIGLGLLARRRRSRE